MAPMQNGSRAARPTDGWAGYLCVAPLVLCLAGVGLLPGYTARELALRISVAWGAALLAFTGGVHREAAGPVSQRPARIAAALAPAGLAAGAILAGGQRGLALLVVGFGGFWLYEHHCLGTQLPPAYLALRRQLSVAICLVLAVTMFLADAAGIP